MLLKLTLQKEIPLRRREQKVNGLERKIIKAVAPFKRHPLK